MAMKNLVAFFAILMLAGALLWNGWIFGYLNHGIAGYLHMSISELEVLHQPHAELFNVLEDASGICLIVGSIGLLIVRRVLLGYITLALLAYIMAIGGLTMFDVSHPLDCNTYNNPICQDQINDNHISQSDQLHNEESRITAYATLVLAVFTLFTVWQEHHRLNRDFLWLSFCTVLIVITLAFLDWDTNVTISAIAERLWNMAVSFNIGYIAWRYLLWTTGPIRKHG
jgi:energy-converting hydrogenase Eha subunit C